MEAELLAETNDLDRAPQRLLEPGPTQVAIKLGGEEPGLPTTCDAAPCRGWSGRGRRCLLRRGYLRVARQPEFGDAVRHGAALGAFCVPCQGGYAGLPTRAELERPF